MSTTHDDATRIAIAATVLARLEFGAAFPSARLILYAADNTVLAVYAMGVPAFPPPTDVMTASTSIAETTNQANGVPHHFSVCDRDGVPRINDTCGVPGSGAGLEVPADSGNPTQPAALIAGQTSSITNLVYQAPP